MKYWEKTVEYVFLTLAVQEKKANFAAPLSGKLERGAGDALFAQNSRYILLEFKMDASGMADEKRKFFDYCQASGALSAKDNHHFFVYGCPRSKRLELLSRTYFSNSPPTGDSGSALGCFADGVDKETFDNYLREFLKYRRPDERGGGGGEDVSDYAAVIGVAPDGASATACSLRDYASHFALGPVSSLASERKSSASPKGP